MASGGGSENTGVTSSHDDGPLRRSTGADIPDEVRDELMEEVRRRLAEGELDTDLALVETAFALLDGDRPAVDD
jgi:hypothetical protein